MLYSTPERLEVFEGDIAVSVDRRCQRVPGEHHLMITVERFETQNGKAHTDITLAGQLSLETEPPPRAQPPPSALSLDLDNGVRVAPQYLFLQAIKQRKEQELLDGDKKEYCNFIKTVQKIVM